MGAEAEEVMDTWVPRAEACLDQLLCIERPGARVDLRGDGQEGREAVRAPLDLVHAPVAVRKQSVPGAAS